MENLKKIILLLLLSDGFFSLVQSQELNDIKAAFEKSYLLEYSGEYQKAIDLLKTVYREDSYEVNLRLGWLEYMGGFFTESLAHYQKAIDLMPLSIEARLGYVYPASALGNWEQVKNQYKNILEIDSQNSLVNYRLGSFYYGNEDYTTALKYFELVVNHYPFDHDALLMYAWTNLKLGKLREAEVLFHKVIMNNPNDESAMEGLRVIK